MPNLRGAFESWRDKDLGLGKRPVIFDVLAPDRTTSLLPDNLKFVLYVNPRTMQVNHTKLIDRARTRGGFVEFNWGDAPETVSFEGATGGFMRLYTGVVGNTSPQGRRQTLAYQKYLDLLALFHWNGAVFDQNGQIAAQGYLQMTFDEGVYTGWFQDSLTITESAQKPFMFDWSGTFVVETEVMNLRTVNFNQQTGLVTPTGVGVQPGQTIIGNDNE